MIVTVTDENRHEHRTLLDDMHAMRYRVIKRWNWNVPGIQEGYDKDEFDTDATIYFLDVDDKTGSVIGTCRFNPTTGPHLLREVFPEMCSFDGVPSENHVWEATRYIIDGHGIPKWQEMRSRSLIALALCEYAHAHNITHMSWLTTQALYNNMFKLWPSRPLGLPKYFEQDDNTYIAALSELTPEATAVLRGRIKQFPESSALSAMRRSA